MVARRPVLALFLLLLACPFTTGRVLAQARYDHTLEAFVGGGVPSPVSNPGHARGVPRFAAVEHLYGSDVGNVTLVLIDKTSAGFSTIGPVGTPVLASLAFDGPSGLLYGTDAATANLVTVDPGSGATVIIGNTGIPIPHGAAIDRETGILYVAGIDHMLYRVSKDTGVATLIGPFGIEYISALDFDPSTGILYGAHAEASSFGHLYTIDTATGHATLVAETHRFTGIAFDQDGVLYAADNGAGSGNTLFLVDKADGSWTAVGDLGPGNILAIEFDSLALPTATRAATWGGLKLRYR